MNVGKVYKIQIVPLVLIIGVFMQIKELINRALIKTFYHWKTNRMFGHCGKESYCIKPIRIINGNDVYIGNNVSILNSLRIETYRIDSDSMQPVILIGDNTNIEQNVHITGGARVHIGAECSILFGSVITDINHTYTDPYVPVSKQEMKCKPVHIGDQCFIGAHSIILPGTNLGRHVIVGANSVVKGTYPDNCVITGIPAKIVKRYDSEAGKWSCPFDK